MKKEDNTNLVSVKDRFLKTIAYLKGKMIVKYDKDIVETLKIYKSNFSKAKKGDTEYLTESFIEKFCNEYGFNKDWITNGTGEMLITEEKEQLPASDLKPKIYGSSLKVRLVTNTAKAGWSDGFYSEEYLEDMPFVMIDADEEHKGEYMAFEVDGDSMEPDYMDGNIVICREVQRHLWQSKLHYKEWDFVIAHAKEGIYLKEIIDHDVEKGIITCHSINPAYPDFKVNLREVTFLYNVVETRQQGKRKRLNRAKDFFETEYKNEYNK